MVMEATKITRAKPGLSRKIWAGLGTVLLMTAFFAPQVWAVTFDTGNPDWKVVWDNTFTYSAVYRLDDQDEELISNANMDDGDRNFDAGLVMNRLDLFSELDISYKRFGIRLSGAGWYDQVYNESNDNDNPLTVNQLSKDHDEFSDDTEELHGRYAELLDAFTFGGFYLGDMKLTYRAGQFAQWWGESFFFGGNGVAAGLAPVDLPKVGTMPNAQGKEMIIPVPQVSATLQMTSSLELGAYYQFKWKPGRWFGSGSYFAFVDLIGTAEPEYLILVDALGNAGPVAYRGDDQDARDDGQYGVKLKYTTPNGIDLGLYYLNYHWKEQGGDNVAVLAPGPGPPTEFFLFYPEDIKLYGISANAAVGIWTIGAEVSYRQDALLVSQDLGVASADEKPTPARGETLHYNLNFFMPGLPSNFFSDTADFIFEIGGNRRMDVTENEDHLDPNANKSAWEMKAVYTPKWNQVLPGLNLSLPMGFTYVADHLTSVANSFFPYRDGGDFNIGIGGTYLNVWDFELTYRNFWGSSGDPETGNPWTDRDYISFFIRRAF